jgi:hypothetical protein
MAKTTKKNSRTTKKNRVAKPKQTSKKADLNAAEVMLTVSSDAPAFGHPSDSS